MFGWQRPCYLLGEGYAKTFKELMEETDWDRYGTGNYEKCADCMVHSGFEASAVMDAVQEAVEGCEMLRLLGIKTEGPMAPEIPLDGQRPAEYVFSRHVEQKLTEIAKAEAGARGGRGSGIALPSRACVSAASRSSAGSWPGCFASEASTARISISPSLRIPASAAAGMSALGRIGNHAQHRKGQPMLASQAARRYGFPCRRRRRRSLHGAPCFSADLMQRLIDAGDGDELRCASHLLKLRGPGRDRLR